jgi:glyoxylase-like metal-dependent hydrolase (beta-lactamase superfamily II)
MKNRIRGSVLSFALFFSGTLVVGCEKEAPTNDTTTAPEQAKPLDQGPAVVPPAQETAAMAKKLAVEVVTGSQDGFLVNSTLVTGDKDAVLIDAMFTLPDAKKLAERVSQSGKTLTTVYVTHSHPDHYFGFPALKERFPNARLVALPSTITEIEKTWEAKVKQWQPQYKDAITSKPVVPEALTGNSIDLEGQKLEIVGGQQGDSADNSYVWIPSSRTVITGDIVYDDVYPWTAETSPEARKTWSETLDKILALKPEKVVPGHQKPEKKLDPQNVTFTKNYLVAYDEALGASKTATELQSKIKAKYPDAALDVVLKIGAEASFNKARTKSPAAEKEPGAKTTGQTEAAQPGTRTPGQTETAPK